MGGSRRSMFSSIPIPHNHAVISLASLASPSVRTFRHTDIREHEPRLERNASADLRSRNLNSGTSPTLGFQFPAPTCAQPPLWTPGSFEPHHATPISLLADICAQRNISLIGRTTAVHDCRNGTTARSRGFIVIYDSVAVPMGTRSQ